MMRVIRFALVWTAIVTAGTTVARAQAPADEERKFSGAIAVGATLGHKSDSSVSGEFGFLVRDQIEVFAEGGRMGNVATTTLDARAATIANFIGASTSAVQKAKFFDVGVRYRGPAISGMWRPYIGIGVGVASVETLVNFAVNGNDITAVLPTQFGIELGTDLSGSATKTFITVPLGVRGRFNRLPPRYFIDGSYRYGRILPAGNDVIEDDVAINTQRIQIAFGVRF